MAAVVAQALPARWPVSSSWRSELVAWAAAPAGRPTTWRQRQLALRRPAGGPAAMIGEDGGGVAQLGLLMPALGTRAQRDADVGLAVAHAAAPPRLCVQTSRWKRMPAWLRAEVARSALGMNSKAKPSVLATRTWPLRRPRSAEDVVGDPLDVLLGALGVRRQQFACWHWAPCRAPGVRTAGCRVRSPAAPLCRLTAERRHVELGSAAVLDRAGVSPPRGSGAPRSPARHALAGMGLPWTAEMISMKIAIIGNARYSKHWCLLERHTPRSTLRLRRPHRSPIALHPAMTDLPLLRAPRHRRALAHSVCTPAHAMARTPGRRGRSRW